jgi:hypothetical protein
MSLYFDKVGFWTCERPDSRSRCYIENRLHNPFGQAYTSINFLIVELPARKNVNSCNIDNFRGCYLTICSRKYRIFFVRIFRRLLSIPTIIFPCSDWTNRLSTLDLICTDLNMRNQYWNCSSFVTLISSIAIQPRWFVTVTEYVPFR